MNTKAQEPKPCRFCGHPLHHPFVDLGMSPLCQKHVTPERLNHMEPFYPLHTWVCSSCFLVQLEEYVAPPDLFEDYQYFSSFSDSWVEHAKRYCDVAIQRFEIGPRSTVMEIASNDGYLLQHLVQRGIPCRGIEPAANVAQAAVSRGIPTTTAFFGHRTAKDLVAKYGRADLLIGNNVLAHVPDLNDFVKGLRELLASDGAATLEFPHLQRLIEGNQFDTIYHEHFSYFSFSTVVKIFQSHGLTIFDVEELPTHGGSLRTFAKLAENAATTVEASVERLLEREDRLGYLDLKTYSAFADKVRETKRKLLEFLIDVKRDGKTVVGYGAPGKGNTLLNYCGIRSDFLDYTVDRSPHKQGNFTPGTRIPIHPPEMIEVTKPDYVLILPWNLKDEIVEQMAHVGNWGGRFVVPIPELRVLEPSAALEDKAVHAAP